MNSNLFDSIYDLWHLEYFLFDIFEWFDYFNKMRNNLFNLDNLRLLNYQRLSQNDLFDNSVLNSLDDGFLYKLFYDNKLLMNQWSVNIYYDLFWHFLYIFDYLGNDFLYLFYPLFHHYFLYYPFNFNYSGLSVY